MGVAHGVQQVDAVGRPEPLQAGDGGPGRHGAGGDDEAVVADGLLAPGGVGGGDLVRGDVDAPGGGVGEEANAERFEVCPAAMGEVVPVGDVTGDVVGDAADAEVWVGIGEHDGDRDADVELPGAQRGGDAAVASSDAKQAGHADRRSAWVRLPAGTWAACQAASQVPQRTRRAAGSTGTGRISGSVRVRWWARTTRWSSHAPAPQSMQAATAGTRRWRSRAQSKQFIGRVSFSLCW